MRSHALPRACVPKEAMAAGSRRTLRLNVTIELWQIKSAEERALRIFPFHFSNCTFSLKVEVLRGFWEFWLKRSFHEEC